MKQRIILLCIIGLLLQLLNQKSLFAGKGADKTISNSNSTPVVGVPPAQKTILWTKPTPAKSPAVNHYPLPKRIDISHIEGKGIGYSRGYTQLSAILGPEYQIGHFLPLIDIKGSIFDDGRWSGHLGFIGRFLPKSLCEIFGFTLFYDFSERSQGSYHQVGGGFEVLNKRWEVHTKGLIPVGARTHSRTSVFDNYVGPYQFTSTRVETASYFWEANAGYYLVNGKNFQLYAAAGPYYFSANQQAWGGKAMVRPQYRDFLYVELSASRDHINKTIYQVNVILSIPLYNFSSRLKNKKGPCGMSSRQVYQPIDPEIVVIGDCCCKGNF